MNKQGIYKKGTKDLDDWYLLKVLVLLITSFILVFVGLAISQSPEPSLLGLLVPGTTILILWYVIREMISRGVK